MCISRGEGRVGKGWEFMYSVQQENILPAFCLYNTRV